MPEEMRGITSTAVLLQALEQNDFEMLGCRPVTVTPAQLVKLRKFLERNTSVKEIGLMEMISTVPRINMVTVPTIDGLLPAVTAALCATGSTLETLWFFSGNNPRWFPDAPMRPSLQITMNKFGVLRVVLGRSDLLKFQGGVAEHAMTAMVLGVLAKNTASLDVFIEKGDLTCANGLQLADIIWNKTDSSAITLASCRFDPVGLAAIARAVVLKGTVTMQSWENVVEHDTTRPWVWYYPTTEVTNALSTALAIERQKLENWKTNMLAFAAGLHQRVGEHPTLVSSLSEELVHEIFRVFYKR
jgi:hypothetical protein